MMPPEPRCRAAGLLIALLAAGAAIGVPTLAGANPAQLGYQVYFGGIKALSFQAELDVSGAAYRAKLDARTEGMIAWVFEYTARAQTEGQVVGGALQPSRHVVESTARGNKRDTRLTFLPGGAIDSVVEPPPDADERDPVTAEQQ